MMIWLGIAGGALLLAFTVWLAWRNRTPEVYKPLISVAVGGVVAVLVTLLTILRPSEAHRSFVSSVVIDERTHLPAAIGVVGSPRSRRQRQPSKPDYCSTLDDRVARTQGAIRRPTR